MSEVTLTSVEVLVDGDLFRVTPCFSGVDHPKGTTWSFRDGAIAHRHGTTMLAGKCFDGLSPQLDIYGKTFARYDAQNFATVTIEDDLKEMGY